MACQSPHFSGSAYWESATPTRKSAAAAHDFVTIVSRDGKVLLGERVSEGGHKRPAPWKALPLLLLTAATAAFFLLGLAFNLDNVLHLDHPPRPAKPGSRPSSGPGSASHVRGPEPAAPHLSPATATLADYLAALERAFSPRNAGGDATAGSRRESPLRLAHFSGMGASTGTAGGHPPAGGGGSPGGSGRRRRGDGGAGNHDISDDVSAQQSSDTEATAALGESESAGRGSPSDGSAMGLRNSDEADLYSELYARLSEPEDKPDLSAAGTGGSVDRIGHGARSGDFSDVQHTESSPSGSGSSSSLSLASQRDQLSSVGDATLSVGGPSWDESFPEVGPQGGGAEDHTGSTESEWARSSSGPYFERYEDEDEDEEEDEDDVDDIAGSGTLGAALEFLDQSEPGREGSEVEGRRRLVAGADDREEVARSTRGSDPENLPASLWNDYLTRRRLWGGDPVDLACVTVWPFLCKFVDELPIPETLDMTTGGTLTMGAWRTSHQWHRDLPNATVYAYGPSREEATVPAPTLAVQRHIPVHISWENHMDDREPFYPLDPTLDMARPPNGGVPMVPHLHGSYTEPESDGNPDAWFTAFGDTGPGCVKMNYTYVNVQEATTLWYHDHTLGITRSSVYAGLYGLYYILDPALENKLSLPRGPYEVPLVIQDKVFNEDGSLWFPTGDVPSLHPWWFPGTTGNVTVVNGKAWPYLNVRRRQYRFRILEASNARFYNIHFVATPAGSGYGNGPFMENGQPPKGITIPFTIIGSDGGYLPKPETVESLLLAPAERVQVIVDFSTVDFGGDGSYDVFLTNDAAVPYPDSPLNPPNLPVDSNTVVIMKFVVEGGNVYTGEPLPAVLTTLPPLNPLHAVRERFFTLTEYYYEHDINSPVMLLEDMRGWNDPVTELPAVNTTEVWTFINMSPGTHPMHVHLIQHRLLGRRNFDVTSYRAGNCTFTDFWSAANPRLPTCWTGPFRGPRPHETGWKDTSQNNPGMTTSYLINWKLQDGNPFPFDASAHPGYVWHCHILDHEDNEMMRPIKLVPAYT